MKKLYIIFILLLFGSHLLEAQVGVGTQTPDASAELDVSSTDKGILIPRLADQSLVNNPATGLIIYNTTQEKFYFFTGTRWQELSPWDYRKGPNAADEDDMIMTLNNNKNAGLNANTPQSLMSVGGNASIGSTYANSNAAPANGLLVEGNVGIGNTNPGSNQLSVTGNSLFTGTVTINGTIGATGGTVPIGAIIMWSGNPNTLPSGWALCDGSGTYTDFMGNVQNIPNLSGRFIAGVGSNGGSTFTMNTTGGTTSHSHTVNSHNHSIEHNHPAFDVSIPSDTWDGSDRAGATALFEGGTDDEYLQWDADGTISANPPNFTGTSGNRSPGTDSINNLPPYYTLAYIIRVN